MGKLVIGLFFLAGFIVFSLIKHASNGVKAAYHHVNRETNSNNSNINDDNAEKRTATVDFCSKLLLVQLELASVENWKPTKWELGYMVGLTDVIMQNGGIDDDVECISVLTLVFIRCMGMEPGSKNLRFVLDNQEDEEVMKGKISGGQEMITFIRERIPPLGLLERINESQKRKESVDESA